MDPFLMLVVVVVVGAVVAWWLVRRRRPMPTEDEWTLPPESGRPGPAAESAPQLLDRDSLVNRTRRFDPSRWDNSPDGESSAGAEQTVDEETVDDLPRFYDRDYLARKDPRVAERPPHDEPDGGANPV